MDIYLHYLRRLFIISETIIGHASLKQPIYNASTLIIYVEKLNTLGNEFGNGRKNSINFAF